MPSQRRTNKSKNAGRKRHHVSAQGQHDHLDQVRDGALPEQQVDRPAPVEGQQRWRRVGVPVPPVSVISTVSTVSGGSGLAIAIATGQVQPGVIWPTVTLVIAGMAYDIARQALHRNRRV